jgi:hypothetical protein
MGFGDLVWRLGSHFVMLMNESSQLWDLAT